MNQGGQMTKHVGPLYHIGITMWPVTDDCGLMRRDGSPYFHFTVVGAVL